MVKYCLYRSKEEVILHYEPVSTFEDFKEAVGINKHGMTTPNVYKIYKDFYGEPEREKIDSETLFQMAVIAQEVLYLYDGGPGKHTPPKGKDGLPLSIRTKGLAAARVSMESSASPTSGSPSSSKHQADVMMGQVMIRDRSRCVITNVHTRKEKGQNCHIVVRDFHSRKLPLEFVEILKEKLTADEWAEVDPLLTPYEYEQQHCNTVIKRICHDPRIVLSSCALLPPSPVCSHYYQVEIPCHFTQYDPRIGLFCQTRFNGPIQRGLVWFQTYPDEERVTVHFDPRLYEEVDRKDYEDFDTKEIRRPDADADPNLPADSEITDDEKSSRLLNWPPKIVFDLHRLVLVPYERWKLKREE